jgi:hypothetical protein
MTARQPSDEYQDIHQGHRVMKKLLITFGVLMVSAGMARAQQYAIDWYSIDGGGGTSTGGNYSLTGTIGQPDATPMTLSGGNFSLDGGFIPGVVVPSNGQAPTLIIQFSGTGTAGFTLEQKDDISAPVWSAAPAGNPTAIIPVTGTTRFYRLRN